LIVGYQITKNWFADGLRAQKKYWFGVRQQKSSFHGFTTLALKTLF